MNNQDVSLMRLKNGELSQSIAEFRVLLDCLQAALSDKPSIADMLSFLGVKMIHISYLNDEISAILQGVNGGQP